MFEVWFNCESSEADFILFRLLLKTNKYKTLWHTFEVDHNNDKATISFYSKTDDCASLVSCLAGLDEEDINITAT